MEFSEVLNYILYIVLTAILPVVAKYTVNLIKTKIKESNVIANVTQNENISKIIENAFSNVMDAVLYINQIYVDALKSNGKFDKDAQKNAFNRAYTEALNIISDESKRVIQQTYGSFDKWLKLKIETSVNLAKKQV
jgi:hypothetical protein